MRLVFAATLALVSCARQPGTPMWSSAQGSIAAPDAAASESAATRGSARDPKRKKQPEPRRAASGGLTTQEREFLATEAADDSTPDRGPVNGVPAPSATEIQREPDPRGTLTAIATDGTRTPIMGLLGGIEACKLFVEYLSPSHKQHLYCTDMAVPRTGGRKTHLFMVSDDDERLMGFAANDAARSWAAASLRASGAFFFCDDIRTRWKP